MLLYMMYKDEPIVRFDASLSLSGLHIRDNSIIKPALLPKTLSEISQLDTSMRSAYFANWLHYRVIPNSRTNLERTLIQLYQLRHPTWGRLYGLQHTVALLCHYMSMYDDYWLNPTRTEAICHVYEEPYFDSLYLLYQSNYQHLLDLRNHPDTDTGRILVGEKLSIDNFDGLDTTVHTNVPARWSKVNGKTVLVGTDGKPLHLD